MNSMKLKSFALLAMTLLLGVVSEANQCRRYRYHTSYTVWDSSFYSTYSYTERTTYRSCGSHTCYYRETTTWRSSDRVYVEESVVTGGRWNGYNRVVVYEDSYYNRPYVSYYVRGNRVIYREYHTRHYYIYRPYTVGELVADEVRSFDSDLKALAVTGAVAIDIGLSVAKWGAILGDKDTAEAGLVIAAAGSGSALSASAEQNARDQERTALANAIIAEERRQQERQNRLQ